MASGDPELKGGHSISQWIKSKPGVNKRDFEAYAASPPPHEDSFFYFRYPKTDSLFPSNKQSALVVAPEQQKEANPPAGSRGVDWTKHTKPCRDVLHGFANPITTAANLVEKPKPAGTDDGFKGEGAACGSSVLKVAHKMVSSRSVSQRGFTVAQPVEEESDATPPPATYNAAARRGSRSLPASPLHSPPGSPNSRRRGCNANRFFTSPFEPSDALNSRSWLTMALLGYKKDMASSNSTLAEEDIQSRLQGNSLVASVESLGPAPHREADPAGPSATQPARGPALNKSASACRPKATEFREINFWSPTSM